MLKGFAQTHYNDHSLWDKTWGRFVTKAVILWEWPVWDTCVLLGSAWKSASSWHPGGESGSTFPCWHLLLWWQCAEMAEGSARITAGGAFWGERKVGKRMLQWTNSKLFFNYKKEWRENEIKVKDKKNLLKAGQSYHANNDFKWKIKKISNEEKRSKKVASIKIKLLSQSWNKFRREGFFFFPQIDLFL